ncbi:rod shape-determining protein [Yinghuangia aomiensis]
MRAIVGVPHDSGLHDLVRRRDPGPWQGLGIKRVELVDVPAAAAVGCGLTVDVPEANAMVVVVGAATSQIAVLSLGAVVASTIVHVGGDAIEHAITEHLLEPASA